MEISGLQFCLMFESTELLFIRADPTERYNRTTLGSVGKLRGYHKEQLKWVNLLESNFVNFFMNW